MWTGLLSIKQGKGKNKKDWGVRGVVREEVGGEGKHRNVGGLRRDGEPPVLTDPLDCRLDQVSGAGEG